MSRPRKGLTLKEEVFVDAITNKNNPKTFLNQRQSAMVAYPGRKEAPEAIGYRVAQRPAVRKTMRERLADPKIDEMLDKGVKKRLEDPMSRHWQATADYVSKIRGDFAAEKHVNLELTNEEKDEKYAKILQLARKDG